MENQKLKAKVLALKTTIKRVALEKLKMGGEKNFAHKKKGHNPCRTNSKRHIETDSDEKQRF